MHLLQGFAISIHALLAESDAEDLKNTINGMNISIHALLAESDACQNGQLPGIYHFYPRSPCGERLENPLCQVVNRRISIHALLAESDLRILSMKFSPILFLSTLSLRRATAPNRHPCCCNRNFYPRSPCGERHWTVNIQRPTAKFLSTLSLRRATKARPNCQSK